MKNCFHRVQFMGLKYIKMHWRLGLYPGPEVDFGEGRERKGASMKNSGSENRCTILSALTEKIVPYNLHVSMCLSIVYYAILTYFAFLLKFDVTFIHLYDI